MSVNGVNERMYERRRKVESTFGLPRKKGAWNWNLLAGLMVITAQVSERDTMRREVKKSCIVDNA